jgi:C_GCAxxG_C_C family probable redox protein
VLTAFASEFGLPDEIALKLAAPFGGGMARTGRICGAVSGGLMALGLKFGFTTPEGRDATYALTREFMGRFESLHGALDCSTLLGFKILTPADRERAGQAGVFEEICPRLVRDSAKIVQELLVKEK